MTFLWCVIVFLTGISYADEFDINECATDNGGCDQICVNEQGKSHCECRPGYILAQEVKHYLWGEDQKTCNDIDECAIDNGGCNHICFNRPGSFACLCAPGFFLADDGKICKATKPKVCPAIPDGILCPPGDEIEGECYEDSECDGDGKCCSNGCALICTKPVSN